MNIKELDDFLKPLGYVRLMGNSRYNTENGFIRYKHVDDPYNQLHITESKYFDYRDKDFKFSKLNISPYYLKKEPHISFSKSIKYLNKKSSKLLRSYLETYEFFLNNDFVKKVEKLFAKYKIKHQISNGSNECLLFSDKKSSRPLCFHISIKNSKIRLSCYIGRTMMSQQKIVETYKFDKGDGQIVDKLLSKIEKDIVFAALEK